MTRFKTLELTDDEALVLNMRKNGKSPKQVMDELGLTLNQAARRFYRARQKLAAKARLEEQGTRRIRF